MESDAVADDGKQNIGVNFDIAMVIPAEKIHEVLTQFAEQERLEADDARKKQGLSGMLNSSYSPNVTAPITTVKGTPYR